MSKMNTEILESKMSKSDYQKLNAIANPKIQQFIAESAELCSPDKIFICSDTAEDIAYVRKQVLAADEERGTPPRFGLYRWHIVDPIRFEQELRVTIQALGWQSEGRYLPLEDDISSVAFWYQTEPHAPFPALPSKESLAIVK